MRARAVLACLLSGAAMCAGQAGGNPEASDTLLSPDAAYERAIAPVDITHRDVANWSVIELNALGVAVGQAKTACAERQQVQYRGDALIGYAKLCALGQQWPDVYRAATQHINSGDKERPQLAQAYAYEVQADLNMKQEKDALGACIAMLRVVPYSALVDNVTTGAARYMQFAYTADALELLINRQRVLLGLLRGAQPDGGEWPIEPTVSPIPLHTVVQHALDDASLHQYMGRTAMAGRIVADIDDAMPKSLPADEAILIAAERRQYALLGTRMPELKGAMSLDAGMPASAVHPIAAPVTVFLLFPAWCAQCVRLAPELAAAAERNKGETGLKVYALLADTAPAAQQHPPVKSAGAAGVKRAGHAAKSADANEPAKTAAELLNGTPTWVVPPSTLDDFGAADFPYLIATDHNGVIRLMYPAAPNNALVEDGIVDQIAESILANWPLKETRSAGAGQ